MNKKRFIVMQMLQMLVFLSGYSQNKPVSYIYHYLLDNNPASGHETLCENEFIERNYIDISDWEDQGNLTLTGGKTYVVTKDVYFKKQPLTVVGKAKLVICNGVTLTCRAGVKVQASDNATLDIYAQSSDEDVMGKLIANNCLDSDDACIGGRDGMACGTVNIHGGHIIAEPTMEGGGGAAIGGGEDSGIDGAINIYGGHVYASIGDHSCAAAIGGGYAGDQGGDITIYGGRVVALGGENGVGIGAGLVYCGGGYGGRINIFGGDVLAQGGIGASAVGAEKGESTINVLDGRLVAVQYGGEVQAIGHCYSLKTGFFDTTPVLEHARAGIDLHIGDDMKVTVADAANGDWKNEQVYFVNPREYGADSRVDIALFSKNVCIEKCNHANMDYEGGKGTCENCLKTVEINDLRQVTQIFSAADWELFAKRVAMGIADGDVKLCNNITVKTQVGVGLSCPFSGTFDGQGYTLTLDINNHNLQNDGTAAFGFVKDATIKNLHIDGKVKGGIHTAGLVGYAEGTCDIENCRVSANVIFTGNDRDDAHGGGFVGHARNADVTLTGCLFDGKLTAIPNGMGNVVAGSLVGWGEVAGSQTMKDCVTRGSYEQIPDGGIDMCFLNTDDDEPACVTIDNCFPLDGKGRHGYANTHTVKCARSFEISFPGGYEYSVSGITCYGIKGKLLFEGVFRAIPFSEQMTKIRFTVSLPDDVEIFATRGHIEKILGDYYLQMPEKETYILLCNRSANGIFDETETTGINSLTSSSIGDESGYKQDDAWYTLDGTRLNGEPTDKGVYIHGGKKIMKR